MRVVYEAENLIDAHLVKGLLENEGLFAFVRGEHLAGGLGDLPVMGLMAVCVADADVAAADRVLAQWRASFDAAPVEPSWGEPDPA